MRTVMNIYPSFTSSGANDRIRKAREAAGLSQSQVVAVTRFPKKDVERWEARDVEYPVVVLRTLATLFGVSYKYLLHGHIRMVTDFIAEHIDEPADVREQKLLAYIDERKD